MLRRAVAVIRSAIASYGEHACSEFAAAIAYRVLFALVPFVALLTALVDAVMPDTARENAVDWLLNRFPGDTVESSVHQELASSGALTSVAGLIAFGTLMWTASGMTRSLRVALFVIWGGDTRPTFVRAKLRDLAALGVLAALVLAVFGLSIVTQVAVQAGVSLTAKIGLDGASSLVSGSAELIVTLAATFAALVLIYRLAAPVPVPLASVWRGALLTAVVIDVGVAAYAFYLVQIASFNTIYGPLGAVLAFLALLYFAAMLVLFGAELVVASNRARDSSLTGDVNAVSTG